MPRQDHTRRIYSNGTGPIEKRSIIPGSHEDMFVRRKRVCEEVKNPIKNQLVNRPLRDSLEMFLS